MSLWVFFKLFGDMCLFYAVLGGLPALFPHQFPFFIPALLCAAGAGIGSALIGRGGLRYIALILPLASLLLVTDIIELLCLLPPMLYAAVVIIRGQPEIEYYHFRVRFLNCLKGFLVLWLAMMILQELQKTMPGQFELFDANAVFRYGIPFVIVGIFLLRQVRMGAEIVTREKLAGGIQIAISLIGMSVIVVALMAAEWGLAYFAVNLFARAVAFIGLPFVWFFSQRNNPPPNEVVSAVPSYVPTASPSLRPMPTPISTATPPPEEVVENAAPPQWLLVLLVSLVIAFTALMFVTWTRHRSERKAIHTAETSGKAKSQKEQIGGVGSIPNRMRMRRYYREFLKTEQARGLKRNKSQTSADILESLSERTDPEAAAELRKLYLSARYDETRPVTDVQLKAARTALKKSNTVQIPTDK